MDIKTSGLKAVQAAIKGLERQLPYMLSRSVNDAAFKVRAAEQDEMRQVFDRPTPYVLRSVYVQKGRAQQPSAQVGHVDAKRDALMRWSETVRPHVIGGRRAEKGTESRLSRMGIMPAGWRVVPGPAMPLNAYGNPKPSEYARILSFLRAYTGRARRLNRSSTRPRARATFFAVEVGSPQARGIRPGIYKRDGSGIHPMLYFVRGAEYRPQLNWVRVARKTVDDAFPAAFDRELTRELARQRTRRGS
ncbi:hypothetical protein [Marichromatium purpuratum]|nr:hypothetical protein [Marichromatium purpuratum]